MATWKERGEVPDSDDDGDLEVESVDGIFDNECNDERLDDIPRNDEETVRSEDDSEQDAGNILRRNGGQEDCSVRSLQPQDDPADLPHNADEEEAVGEDLYLQQYDTPEEAVEDDVDIHTALSTPKSSSQRSIDAPFSPLWFEKDAQQHDDKFSEPLSTITSIQDVDEEGSTSFVQLHAIVPSSPLGSLPSLSQLPLPPNTTRSPSEIGNSTRPVVEISRAASPIYRQRTFRHRKQIQLHPYEIEKQNYRKRLQERGIAPVNIADSQEVQRSASLRQESHRSDQETQDLNGSSNDEMEIITGAQQLPPSQQSSQLSERNMKSLPPLYRPVDSQDDSDNDEFPDVHDLLRVGPSERQFGIKRRAKTYSSKAKRHRTSADMSQPRSQPVHDAIIDYLEAPASPPVSSSPPRTAARRAFSRVVSGVSQRSASFELPLFFRDDEQESLPTPATSSVRRPPAIYVESDPEEEVRAGSDDDDQASDSSLQSNSSDKLMHFNGKKIKGVLPASHLRLNSQVRRRSPSLPAIPVTRRSLSPLHDRRGVAQRAQRKPQRKHAAGLSPRLGLLSDMSDDDDATTAKEVNNSQRLSDHGTLLTESRVGIAEEGDSVDMMLPALKRHRDSNLPTAKRRKTSPQRPRVSGLARQPKITEHIQGSLGVSRPRHMVHAKRMTKKHKSQMNKGIPRAPYLSVLDAMMNSHDESPPLFLRLAARTVRKRNDLGRHSPGKKFIKLATREDTIEAQSVLQNWRDSKIQPSRLRSTTEASISPRDILRHISGNQQQPRLSSPSERPTSKVSVSCVASKSLKPRKLRVAQTAQQNIRSFVSSGEHVEDASNATHPGAQKASSRPAPRPNPPRKQVIRPGQLEAEDRSTPSFKPRPKFQIAKGVLDKMFKDSHQKSRPQNNVALRRFLADEDVIFMSTEEKSDNEIQQMERARQGVKTVHPTNFPTRRRKVLQPRQFDIGAAFYRQSSEQLQLEVVPREITAVQGENQNKLQGLVYRPTYPVTFNILPLPPGVFFHHSTFLGGGKLANLLKDAEIRHGYVAPMTLCLGDIELSWSTWNETVSSELGTSFDWVSDKMCLDNKDDQVLDIGLITSTLESVLAYFESHITFSSDSGVDHFLTRASAVLSDFVANLEQTVVGGVHSVALSEIPRIACLICLRVLLLARTSVQYSQKALQVEEVLKSFARIYVRGLLEVGTESFNTTYDKLQYLSYREHGLGTDHKILECWVVVIRILAKAAITRGTFWDVVNPELCSVSIQACDDAGVMEDMWHKVFRFLPLFEFDDFGVLISGQRHSRTMENWALPQQMVKRITEFYTANVKQLSGFKNYCRALINRCLHLMIEWGWWSCAAITGTIFDFFARRNLAHLRHEESSTSPQFLFDLHMNPSLAVENDDLCFHVFLKMVGLGIKHAAEVNNEKLARNLVTRLLPNHDRHFSKEESILKSDLESLRNHHDLLCTLFWAAPKKFKPSLTLLRKLVDVDQSHTRACKINFHAWEHICHFLVTHHPEEDMISPLAEWHKSSLNALWQQYSNTEAEIRRQADDISSKDSNGITENQILEATKVNKDATRPILNMMLQAIAHVRNFNVKTNVGKHFFDLRFIAQLLDHRPVEDFSTSLIDILQYYIWLIGKPVEDDTANDSQDSFLGGAVLERFGAIQDFADIIIRPLKTHLQAVLASPINDSHIVAITACWASLLELAAEEELQGYGVDDLLGKGRHALFDHTSPRPPNSELFWVLLLDDLLSRCADRPTLARHLFAYNVNIEGECLRLLAHAPLSSHPPRTMNVIVKLHVLGSCLLRMPFAPNGIALTAKVAKDDQTDAKCVERQNPRVLLRWMLTSMKLVTHGPPGSRGCTVNGRQAKALFITQLRYLMKSIQNSLEGMQTGTTAHHKYVSYVQEICEDIQIHCASIQPLDQFFQHSGTHYWPPRSDPRRFVASAKAYALDLAGESPGRTARSLYYHLQNAFGTALEEGQFLQHSGNIKKALAEPSFLKFVLDEMLAPMLEMGFGVRSVPGGWLFCMAYLPVLSAQLRDFLLDQDKASKCLGGSNASAEIYRWTIKAAETLVFYLQLHEPTFYKSEQGSFDDRYMEIVATSLEFWNVVLPGLRRQQSMESISNSYLDTLATSFQQMAKNIRNMLSGQSYESIPKLFTSTAKFRGVHYEEFRHGLEQYVIDNWMVANGGDCILMKKGGVRVVFGSVDGSVVGELPVKNVGVRRPDLRRALIEFEQGVLDLRPEGLRRSLVAVI